MPIDKPYVVYMHTCNITNKSYIGQTKNLNTRNVDHQRSSSGCIAFRNAIQKYGWSNFNHTILAEGLSLEEANQQEELLIAKNNTIAPFGYNIRSGGLNHYCHPETKRKISEKLKGRKCSLETIEKRRQKTKGRKKPQEFIDRVAKINTGKKRTEEQKKRMSLAALKSWESRQWDTPARQKMIEAKRGVQLAQTTCPHCSKTGRGNAMNRWHFDNCQYKGDIQ